MSLEGGAVVVADDESVTGSGLALAIYQQTAAQNAGQLAAISSAFATSINDPATPDASKAALAGQRDQQRLDLIRSWARTANTLGPAIVDYLKANAVVSLTGVVATVSTGTSVGTVPNPVVAGDPIDPPATAVDLPVTGSGTLG